MIRDLVSYLDWMQSAGMFNVQCPAGEHCLGLRRGKTCLMWHPPSKEDDEEKNQIKLAIEKSLQPERIICQFCKAQVENMDELQIHRINCNVIEQSEPVENETDNFVEQVKGICPDEFSGIGTPEIYSPAVKRKHSSCRSSLPLICYSPAVKQKLNATYSQTERNDIEENIFDDISGVPHCVSIRKKSLESRGYKSFEEWNSNPAHLYIGGGSPTMYRVPWLRSGRIHSLLNSMVERNASSCTRSMCGAMNICLNLSVS